MLQHYGWSYCLSNKQIKYISITKIKSYKACKLFDQPVSDHSKTYECISKTASGQRDY